MVPGLISINTDSEKLKKLQILFTVGCKDRNSRCPEWAAAGFCDRNRYINENCKISCQVSCEKKEDGLYSFYIF